MKKLLALLLSLAVISANGTVAFAEESAVLDLSDDNNSSTEFDVEAIVRTESGEEGGFGGYTYNVVVSWEAETIDVTKTMADVYKWNPEKYSYELVNGTTGLKSTEIDIDEWGDVTKDSMFAPVNILITNNSDIGIDYKIVYNPVEENGKKLSGLYNEDWGVSTEDELLVTVSKVDSVLGYYGLEVESGQTYKEAFEKYVLDIYTAEEQHCAYGKTTIEDVCTFLKNEWYYKELISDVTLESASDLLNLYLNDDIVDPELNNVSIRYHIDGLSLPWHNKHNREYKVALTDDGKEFAKTKDSSDPFKIGSFTVTLSTII